MKRAPLYTLILVVAVIIAVLGYFVYLNIINQSDEGSNANLICAVVFLALAFVAIELMFKPHLFLRPREEEEEEEPDL